MAGRDPRAGDQDALVRIRDLAGRPRGTGFVADEHGTVVTSHEAVDGLARLVLHSSTDRTCVVTADAVVPLPEYDLALVRTEGLDTRPLPVTVRAGVETGAYVRIAAGGWREARVLGASRVTYTATDRFHTVDVALELAIGTDGRDALRVGGGAAGGPVLDAATGAVVAVLGTALEAGHSGAGFAVPLRASAASGGPLADLLALNAATVPGHGADLNLAGALQLTATTVGSTVGSPATGPGHLPFEPVERFDTAAEFTSFDAGEASVLALVGDPGTGRTTELAALAGRRARGAYPAPTVWLRGADLLPDDTSVAEAAERALARAGRILAASARWARPPEDEAEPESMAAGRGRRRRGRGAAADAEPKSGPTAPWPGEPGEGADTADHGAERIAALAREAGRPVLLLLDGPEEMPPALAHRLPEWTEGTARWLRAHGVRLVIGCRAEYWEQAGELFPAELLHTPAGRPGGRALPACVRLTDLSAGQSARARALYDLPDGVLAPRDAGHPLTLRLLSEVGHAAFPTGSGGRDEWGVPDRDAVFAAHLDLMCLRTAVRIGAPRSLRGAALRRLAALVCGQFHEAARRCLGPGQGELDRETFEEVFPWGPAPGRLGGAPGWASAVLTEGLLVPAGAGYRFAHEEVGDWIQGTHLDVDAALTALVHRWRDGAEAEPPRAGGTAGPRRGGGPSASRRDEDSASSPSPSSFPSSPAPFRGDEEADTAGYGAEGVSRAEVRRRHRAARRAAKAFREERSDPPRALPSARGSEGSGDPAPRRTLPVPRHRIGPVVEALLFLARQHGPAELAVRLVDLIHAADRLTARTEHRRRAAAAVAVVPRPAHGTWDAARPGAAPGDPTRAGRGPDEPGAGRGFVREDGTSPAGLVHVPGPLSARQGEPHRTGALPADPTRDPRAGTAGGAAGPARTSVLVHVPSAAAGSGEPHPGAYAPHGADAGPDDALPGAAEERTPDPRPANAPWWAVRLVGQTLLRVPDGRPYLGVLRLLAHWVAERGRERGVLAEFGPWFWRGLPLGVGDRVDLLRRLVVADEADGSDRFLDAVGELLAAEPRTVQPLLCRWFTDRRPLPSMPEATVATAAQALLHTHRHRGLDDLVECLVASAHPRAEELLGSLAEEEPSALCRAVDRWTRDERPARRAAAVEHALRAAPHVATDADRELLRHAALAVLARRGDTLLHGGALALLVRDPHTRARHLPRAVAHFAAGDPRMPAGALAAALTTHPEPVLAAFRTRLEQPGTDTGAVLRALADVATPALARSAAAFLRDLLELRPDAAGHAAAYIDRRFERGSADRAILFPLVVSVLRSGPAPVRAALAPVVAAVGTGACGPPRSELLDVLLDREQDPSVLDALLGAVADSAAARGEDRTRTLVRRTGAILVRTPQGAACFDRRLVELSRSVTGFAALVAGWLRTEPQDWAALVGPSTRRMIENLAGGRTEPSAPHPRRTAEGTPDARPTASAWQS